MAELYDKDGAIVTGAMLPDEVTAKVTEAVTAKETEFSGVKTALETELTGAKKALGERATEFAQFRKLSEDAVSKLGEVERQLYENQLAHENERIAREEADKKTQEANVKSFIRTKAGTNEKLFTKMEEMWTVVGIQANTPEEMETKAKMIIGAIGTTEPDLIASLGSMNGMTFAPGQVQQETDKTKTFADTERGIAGAAELGLPIK